VAFALANNFEGGLGLDETVITAANSGGASGDAFTAVTLGGVFEESLVLKGAVCARFDTDGAAGHTFAWTVTSSTHLYGRCYVRKSGNPSAAFRLIRFRGGGVLAAGINLNTAGQLQWLASTSGDTTGGTTFTLTTDVLYRIEFDILFGTGTSASMTASIYQGDATASSGTIVFTGTFTNTVTAADTVQFGIIAGTPAAGISIYIDSVQANDMGMPGPDIIPPGMLRRFPLGV
jgi:hypothetical protein